MINTKIYSSKVRIQSKSMISGEREGEYEVGDEAAFFPWEHPMVKAFLEDDDLQEMRIISTCVGFIKTITKQYAQKPQDQIP